MLTGDNQNTAMMVAQKLGISEVVAGVFPKDKADMIKACKDNKEGVMMVGDGINDAPSLAIADIGVSIRNATDIATDSADVILIDDEIKKIPDFLMIAKRTKTIIKENLFWAFFYNTLMVPIAMGLLENWGIVMNPMWGSLAMMASSLTVVFNSLRLRYFRK